MTGTVPISSKMAFEQFTDHPLFKYRQCAPDVDDPSRAAGDASLSRNAWIMEDRDGAEPQREREAREAATVDVCVSCPVMVLCDRYANSVRPDGRLAEPAGVWGGRTARERVALFKQRRREGLVPVVVAAAAPRAVSSVGALRTPQKLAVLMALAMSPDVVAVAEAAGMDVRTANWQRSRCVTLLGLDRETSSRMELLEAAVGRGLVEASVVVPDDGTVLAVPPPAAPGAPAPAAQLALFRPAGPEVVGAAA